MGLPIEAIVAWLVIGAIAGWLASNIMTGGGLGLVGNIVVGIIGAAIAGWLFPFFWVPIGGPFIGAVINAVIGAIILLFVLGRGLYGGGEEKPITRDEIESPSR